MAARKLVLRLPRTDQKSDHLLLNVASDGPRGLDLELIGTDQENLYRGSLKDSAINSLQGSSFNGTSAEWRSLLLYVLLHETSGGPLPESLEGVEAVSAITGTTVAITVRRNIGGITQKLGTIKLEPYDEEVGLLEWVDTAVTTSDNLRAEVETLHASLSSQQAQVAKLTSQLDDLVKAKKKHEDDLLGKFAALLNSKKQKIRDQQRLLSGAKIDSEIADDVSDARASARRVGRKAGASRDSKRKGVRSIAAADVHVDDEDAVTEDETMEVDSEEGRRQDTPETDDADATDDDLDVPMDGGRQANVPDDSQIPRRNATGNSQAASQRMDIDRGESPASQRELPTRKGKAAARQTTPPPTSAAGDEDDETEDEL